MIKSVFQFFVEGLGLPVDSTIGEICSFLENRREKESTEAIGYNFASRVFIKTKDSFSVYSILDYYDDEKFTVDRSKIVFLDKEHITPSDFTFQA